MTDLVEDLSVPYPKATGNMRFRVSAFFKQIIIEVQICRILDGGKKSYYWRDAQPSDFVSCPILSTKLERIMEK